MQPIEHWLPVVGHEGWYEVSDQGRVRSIPRFRLRRNGVPMTLRGRLLNPIIDPDGYGYVTLSFADASRRRRPIHQLVLAAFVGPMPQGHEVRHLDGDPGNNRRENLRYGTSLENSEDQRKHGRLHWSSRERCSAGHEYTPENTYVGSHHGYPERVCRECRRRREREFWQRKKALSDGLARANPRSAGQGPH
jgi:hypothetical protein